MPAPTMRAVRVGLLTWLQPRFRRCFGIHSSGSQTRGILTLAMAEVAGTSWQTSLSHCRQTARSVLTCMLLARTCLLIPGAPGPGQSAHTADYADTRSALLTKVYQYDCSLYISIRQKSACIARGALWKAAHGTYSRYLVKCIVQLSHRNRKQPGWA